jgi:hypothetical protein
MRAVEGECVRDLTRVVPDKVMGAGAAWTLIADDSTRA